MTAGVDKNYWVLYDSDSRWKYFARFAHHDPKPTRYGTTQRDAAYCFASEADANRVADQLRDYGRRVRVVTERQKPKPPPPPPAPAVSVPPAHLAPWVSKIVEAGRARGKGTDTDRVAAGYRVLARQCHPDGGGSTTEMQHLNDAVKWLRKYLRDDDVPF